MKAGEIEKSARVRDVDLEAVKKKLKAGIERGDFSRGEAEEKIRALKQRIRSAETEGHEINWSTVKMKIEGAVQRGEITRREADVIYRTLKR
jgi:hypothetical protein